MNRAEMLERAMHRQTPWDIVVIGGGATGAGVAVDAASRGYDVLLLEQYDYGKGTSSRSTKLVHGGVRYLEQGNISLVREALHERGLLFAPVRFAAALLTQAFVYTPTYVVQPDSTIAAVPLATHSACPTSCGVHSFLHAFVSVSAFARSASAYFQ